MNARQFFDLVCEMRDAQWTCSVACRVEDLERCRALEGKVDDEIRRVKRLMGER